ncbi:SIS domain-containing protein [Azospirillum sp.]|uniref:SIS domain-containing protein n=1 Tax=Azospirillum sp. TaxID=34012 RepID=UPI002D620162|nr:SIS domain-containing protein [Azospirillum sp.]HYD63860.1 SIS domain-containing protein [Azospirillum sp.]
MDGGSRLREAAGHFEAYVETLARLCRTTEATDGTGARLPLGQAIAWVQHAARTTHACGNTVMFVGNGGSAAIASHCATDWARTAGLRTRTFSDAAALTCFGNDFGYEEVFARQVALHARPGDLLVAISSSGRSMNIRNAAEAARAQGCAVATLSGFAADNPLRGMGDLNLYVASAEYGFVELAHQTICHAVLDLGMGWQPAAATASAVTA